MMATKSASTMWECYNLMEAKMYTHVRMMNNRKYDNMFHQFTSCISLFSFSFSKSWLAFSIPFFTRSAICSTNYRRRQGVIMRSKIWVYWELSLFFEGTKLLIRIQIEKFQDCVNKIQITITTHFLLSVAFKVLPISPTIIATILFQNNVPTILKVDMARYVLEILD